MKLSVIVPCFNMERYVGECIECLLAQSFEAGDYEIIVVNDGSRDATLKIAQDYAQKHPTVRVIDKPNAGVGAARNDGLLVAEGEYIYFLDPDDLVVRDSLPALVDLAAAHDLDVLSFGSMEIGPSEPPPPSDTDFSALTVQVEGGLEHLGRRKVANEIWWYLVRRRFLSDHGLRFVEGRWMEDAILTAQIYCAAARVAHVVADVHRHRIIPTSAMRNRAPEHYRKVIFDNASAVETYDGILAWIRKARPDARGALTRLKTRQQSFVFFLLVRLMQSDLPVAQVPPMLGQFQRYGAYPLDAFLGPDYDGPAYRALVFILNRPALMIPFFRMFRVGQRLLGR